MTTNNEEFDRLWAAMPPEAQAEYFRIFGTDEERAEHQRARFEDEPGIGVLNDGTLNIVSGASKRTRVVPAPLQGSEADMGDLHDYDDLIGSQPGGKLPFEDHTPGGHGHDQKTHGHGGGESRAYEPKPGSVNDVRGQTLYRGNSSVAKSAPNTLGTYLTTHKEFASGYGEVVEHVIPQNAVIFDLDRPDVHKFFGFDDPISPGDKMTVFGALGTNNDMDADPEVIASLRDKMKGAGHTVVALSLGMDEGDTRVFVFA